ncbi:MAG: toll/interleukin-1 receptor domain-containing protein [Cyclobacteriaceae bacterium]
MKGDKKHYDVLFSFSAADQHIVSLIAEKLKDRNISYYDYREAANWGEDLVTETIDTYQKGGAYLAVLIISQNSKHAGWTQRELMLLKDRKGSDKRFRILPLVLGDYWEDLLSKSTIFQKWNGADEEAEANRIANLISDKVKKAKKKKWRRRARVSIAFTLTLSLSVTAYFYHENTALSQRVYLENECTDTSLKPDAALKLTTAGTDNAFSIATEKGQYVVRGLLKKDKGREIAVRLESDQWELVDSVLTVKDRYTALPVRHKHGCTQRYTIRLRDSDNAVPADIDRATLVISDAVTDSDSVFAISPIGETAVQYRRMQGLSVSLTSDVYRLSSPDVSLDPGVNTLYVTPVFKERRPGPGNVVARILLNGDTHATSGTLVNGRPVSPLPGSGFTQRYIRLSKAKDDYEIALVQDDTCRVVADLRSYADNDTLPLIAHCL